MTCLHTQIEIETVRNSAGWSCTATIVERDGDPRAAGTFAIGFNSSSEALAVAEALRKLSRAFG